MKAWLQRMCFTCAVDKYFCISHFYSFLQSKTSSKRIELIEKENKIEMRLQQPAAKPVDEVQEVDYTEVSAGAGAETKQQSIPGF